MAADGFLSSYEVSLKPSSELKRHLKRLLHNDERKSETVRHSGIGENGINGDDLVSFSTIRRLSKRLINESDNKHHIHRLLRGSDICFTKPVDPPRNPVLEERVQRIKRELEDKRYTQMTKNVDPAYKSEHVAEFRSDVKLLRQHMAASVNFIITIVACFLFGYKIVDYALPSPNISAKVLMGLIAGTIGGLADLYFLIRHLDAQP